MKDRKSSADNDPDNEDTKTNVALLPPESGDTDASMHQLEVAVPASNATYSLGRLEHDLKLLHSKWQTVEQEMTRRDEKLSLLQREVDQAQHDNASLEELKGKLEGKLEERQGAAIESNIRHTELESQNVELRVHLQELQDYIDGRKSDWQNLNDQIRDYEDTIAGISGNLREHEDIVAAKEDEKAELAARVMELERELAALKGRYEERESGYAEVQQTLDDKSRELGNLSGETIRLHKDIEKLHEKIARRDDKVRSLERELNERGRDSASAQSLVATEQGRSAELQAKLEVATKRADELEASEAELRAELAANREQFEQVGVSSAEHEIRAVELQAVLLEMESDQKKLEAELEAQRELVQVLELEVSNKQRELDLLDKSADRLSAIGSGIREIDFQIDENWSEQPTALSEESDDIFDAVDDAVMLKPEELFPDPEDLVEHIIVAQDDDRSEPIRYPLTRAEMTIGRSHKADIRLISKYISREHARIKIDESGVVIEDCGSMNGFLVNSEPATYHRLAHGDRLEIGKSKFQYMNMSML